MNGYKEGEILISKKSGKEHEIMFKRTEEGCLWYFLKMEGANYSYPHRYNDLCNDFERKNNKV